MSACRVRERGGGGGGRTKLQCFFFPLSRVQQVGERGGKAVICGLFLYRLEGTLKKVKFRSEC